MYPAELPIQEMLREDSLFHPEPDRKENTEKKDLPEKEYSGLHIIGQVFATYWLIEYKDELLIIDQHAAHEKVLYEKLLSSVKNQKLLSQSLTIPVIVTLSPSEEDALHKNKNSLEKLGFLTEHFGGKEYAVKGVPSDFLSLPVKELFLDFLGEMMKRPGGNGSPDMVLEKCASMACKAAVKGNQRLTSGEAEALIKQMLTLDHPYHCPHGRPTAISMTKTEFEKKFKRIV